MSPLKYKTEDWPEGTRTGLLPLEGSRTKRSVPGSMVGKAARKTGKEEEEKKRNGRIFVVGEKMKSVIICT